MPELWKATEGARAAHEKVLIPRTRDLLMQQGKDLASVVAASGSPSSAIARAQDRAGRPDVAMDALEQIYRRVVPDFGDAAYAGVVAMKQDHEEISDWKRRVRSFLLSDGAGMVTAITATTQEKIRDVLRAGVSDGLGVEALARHLEDEWEDVSRVRSRRIVRTEVMSASNFGTMEGAREAAERVGLDLQKEWITSRDGRERRSHRNADGQIQDMEDPFEVGGHAARYPGDLSLPADERVNCRCTHGFRPITDSAKDWRESRNDAIRSAYPALKQEQGEWAALTQLGEQHALSPHTVRNIVHQTGHYG